MNVGELKAQFSGIPDSAIILTDDRDGWHSLASVDLQMVVDEGYGKFRTPNEHDTVVKVALIFT